MSSFAADGKTVEADAAYRWNGTLSETGKLLANGHYRLRDYWDDGTSLADEKEIGQTGDKWDTELKLFRETKWRPNHKLLSTNVLNDDKSHTLTVFDEHEKPVVVSHMTNAVDQSTVIGYYPGTDKVRLRGSSAYYFTNIQFLRLDGTLELKMQISSSSVTLDHYDATGTKELLRQEWSFIRTEEYGMGTMTDFKISDLTEMDEAGLPSFSWHWNFRKPTVYITHEYNKVLDGIRWLSIYSWYRVSDGTLESADFTSADEKQNHVVKHAAEENIFPPAPPANELVVPEIEDIFPVPLPSRGMD